MVNASIITIGDELLIGQVSDTNSAWMAQQLNTAGIRLRRRIAVGDDRKEIINALDEERKHSDIILLTGGLGPTSDDITKPVLCEYFNGKMIVHEETFAFIKHLFEHVVKRPLLESNIKQAEVPDNCKVLLNKRGTAPGMWFEQDKKIFISLPGVPHEMKGIMEFEVIPVLAKHFTLPGISHRTLLTYGVGESVLAGYVEDLEAKLPSHMKLAYLPDFGQVRLRLSGYGDDKAVTDSEIDIQFTRLQELVKPFIVTCEDEPIEAVVGKMLAVRKKTVCTAESCTGGFIAQLLTSRAGSSAYFEGSIVSYSYKAKEDLLQVDGQHLKDHGAVSEQIVMEMAEGALRNIKTDYVISVSGIMGPDGGVPGKPVGTVWVAAGNKSRLITRKFSLRFDRQMNIRITAVNALNLLREFMMGED